MKFLRIFINYILGVIGILVVSIVPKVIIGKGIFDLSGYLQEFSGFIFQIVKLENWMIHDKNGTYSFIDILKEPYLYSAVLFISAICAGVIMAMSLAYLTWLLPFSVVSSIKKIFSSFKIIHYLLAAFALQLIIFYLYNDLFTITVQGPEHRYFAPILTIFIMPALMIFRIIFLSLREEFHTEFARTKGFSRLNIYFRQIIKNILTPFLYHYKWMAGGTLLSLFTVEMLFNLKGITYLMVLDFHPMAIFISLFLIYTPLYMINQSLHLWLEKKNGNMLQKSLEIRKHLSNGWGILKTHLKNPKFSIGFAFLLGLLIFSIFYTLMKDVPINKVLLMHDRLGKLLSVPPHPPSSQMWFGSDMSGYSIRDQLFVGAKYTLIFGLLIALLRVVGGFIFAIYYTFHMTEKTRVFISKLVDSIHFLPLSLIAYFLLAPILMGYGGWSYSFLERIILEVLILTILVVPLTTVLIGNEMNIISQEMFILSAKTLGGDQKHILWKHIFPHLAPRLFILFGQQFIQVLLIFVHLGLFQLFFGGTILPDSPLLEQPRSATNEWSGLISNSKDAFFYGKYWLVTSTLIAFMLCILAMQLIVQGIKEVQQRKVGVLVPRLGKRKKEHKVIKEKAIMTDHLFSLKLAKQNKKFHYKG